MSAVASFQVLEGDAVGSLRIHSGEGDWSVRTGYTFTCTMCVKGHRAELLGTTTVPSRQELKAMRKLFKSLGITEVFYEIKGREITHKERK